MVMRALGRLREFDEAMLLRVHRLRAPWLTPAMCAFTRLGDTSSWIAFGLLLLACGAAPACLSLAAASVFATLLTAPAKRFCRRIRPDGRIRGFEAILANPDAFSFPSGHTAVAVAVATAFLGEPALAPLAAVLASGVAISRIYLGAHYPLDVAAGAVLGLLAGIAARLLIGG